MDGLPLRGCLDYIAFSKSTLFPAFESHRFFIRLGLVASCLLDQLISFLYPIQVSSSHPPTIFTLSTPPKMAPANSKANYKTYEAQARMVRAIVAAHPDVKWNYKGEHPFLFSCTHLFPPPLDSCPHFPHHHVYFHMLHFLSVSLSLYTLRDGVDTRPQKSWPATAQI